MNSAKLSNLPQRVPIVLILPWMGATAKAISKYIQLYKELCKCEIVVEDTHIWNFLWPRYGLKKCKQFLSKLQKDMFSYDRPLIVHSMSIGCYFYSLILNVLKHNSEEFCKIRRNLVAVVLDSPVTGTLSDMATGLSTSSTANKLGQDILKQIAMCYFASTKHCTVKMYDKLIDILKYDSLIVPSLVMSSLDDPLGLPESYQDLVCSWEKQNPNVISKLWSNSTHAQHLKHHKKEYISLVKYLLNKCLNKDQIHPKL